MIAPCSLRQGQASPVARRPRGQLISLCASLLPLPVRTETSERGFQKELSAMWVGKGLGRPDLASISLRMFAESLFGRAMRGLIAIERDLMRQSALGAESSPEECLGGCDVPLGAQQEIDGLSLTATKLEKEPFAVFRPA